MTIFEIIEWMQQHGQSIIFNWGEDNGLWECSYIDGKGVRHTAFDTTIDTSISRCLDIYKDYYDLVRVER